MNYVPAASRVLIVSHCSECGSSLQLLLSLSGYKVEIIRMGDAVVARANEFLPQAVLVDLNIPRRDVREMCRRLRAALGDAVLLIVITPYEWDGDAAGWAEAGLNGWLRKPVSPEDLFDLLAPTSGPLP